MNLFGDAPMASEELVRELIARVHPQVTRESAYPVWTEAVKSSLRTMGNSLKRAVAPDREQQQKEFMLDLIWWRDKDSNDIDLAVESEWWNKGDICEDFGKLLAVKAPLKVMIYSTSNHDTQSSSIRRDIEQKYMAKFASHVVGERYLLVEFSAPEYRVYAYSFLVEQDGRLGKVEFRELLNCPLWPDSGSSSSRI